MYKILFVCTGNICRSPTAEGVMRKKVEDAGLEKVIILDSAGTHNYHEGSPPDRRSAETAKKYGYDLSTISARKFKFEDYYEFNLILAMDRSHLDYLVEHKPFNSDSEIALYLEYAGFDKKTVEVGDPYYGSEDGFTKVIEMIANAADLIVPKVSAKLRKLSDKAK